MYEETDITEEVVEWHMTVGSGVRWLRMEPPRWPGAVEIFVTYEGEEHCLWERGL
jgi:hypothetical protein